MKDTQLATQEPPQLSTLALIGRIADSGITPQTIEVMERMLAMREREEAKESARAFSDSLSAFQGDMPELVAQTEIPKRGKYERFEDIMHIARPLLVKHGFSVSFRQEVSADRITAICKLSHRAGHSVENSFSVRVANKADTPTQSDCMASTTSKRNALIQALNIIIRQDCIDDENDARNVGAFITEDKAAELSTRVQRCGADPVKFLAFAQAESFDKIGETMLPAIEAMLRAKEKAKPKPAQDLADKDLF
jgi:hypothetical protein